MLVSDWDPDPGQGYQSKFETESFIGFLFQPWSLIYLVIILVPKLNIFDLLLSYLIILGLSNPFLSNDKVATLNIGTLVELVLFVPGAA